VVPMRLIVGPQTSAAFTTKASCSLLLMTGWPSCWSGRSCHKKRPVAAAVKTGMFSRRLQLAPGLEPPTSWSSSPVTTPNIYGRAESLKSPGLGGDLCEDRKIYGRSSVSHPVRCPRHGGALSLAAVLFCTLGQSVGTLVDLFVFCGIRPATECMRCSVASCTSASVSSASTRFSEDIRHIADCPGRHTGWRSSI
jgi:hypothetical protein